MKKSREAIGRPIITMMYEFDWDFYFYSPARLEARLAA